MHVHMYLCSSAKRELSFFLLSSSVHSSVDFQVSHICCDHTSDITDTEKSDMRSESNILSNTSARTPRTFLSQHFHFIMKRFQRKTVIFLFRSQTFQLVSLCLRLFLFLFQLSFRGLEFFLGVSYLCLYFVLLLFEGGRERERERERGVRSEIEKLSPRQSGLC